MLIKIIGTEVTTLVDTNVCEFRRDEYGNAFAVVSDGGDRRSIPIEVKAFLLNAQGDTVDSFSPRKEGNGK